MKQPLSLSSNERLIGRQDVLLWLALLVVLLVALWPALRAPATTAPGLPEHDGRTQWYPWRAFAADSLRDGVVPLWNPYTLCGTPFLGNGQSALFYPPNLVFLFSPIGAAARISIVFHVWLSMVLAYILARILGCGRVGAVIAGLSFGFCASQFLRVPAGHWGVTCAIPWIVLIFIATELICREARIQMVVVGAFAVAMQVLSGAPQYVFISAVSSLLYAAARTIASAVADRKPSGSRWLALAGMWLLGAGISAPQLVPSIEAALNGARSLSMQKEWVQMFSLGPESLITMLIPGFFGGTRGDFYWGPFFFWEMNAFLGTVGLAFALYAIFSLRPRRLTLCLAVTAVVMLLLALGKNTPLIRLVAVLPFADMFRGASKFLLPFSLMLSVLAALGAEECMGRQNFRLGRFLFISITLTAIMLGILISTPGSVSGWQESLVRSGVCLYAPKAGSANVAAIARSGITSITILVSLTLAVLIFRKKTAATAFLILFIAALESTLFAWDFVGKWTLFKAEGSAWPAGAGEAIRSRGRTFRTLAPGLPQLNDGMIEKVPTAEGIEPNPPVWFHELFRAAQGLPVNIAPSIYQLISPGLLISRTAVGNVLSSIDAAPAGPEYPVFWKGDDSCAFSMANAVPRALVVYKSQSTRPGQENLKAALSANPRDIVVLELHAGSSSAGSEKNQTVARIKDEGANYVAMTAELEEAGWLVLLDNYFPGWEAEDNGRPTALYRANYCFRSIPLAKGQHEVILRYRPISLFAGLAMGFAGLAAVALLIGRRTSRASSIC